MKIFNYITLFWLLIGGNILAQQEGVYYRVVKVRDGDTVVLLVDNKEVSVRLNHIDAPEKKQPFGNKAKQFVSDLCFGKKVKITGKHKYDRYKRLLAEITNENGININEELVKNGLAWHFKKYSNDEVYNQLEISARRKKLNIWSEKNPIAPWDYRKLRRKNK